VRVPPVRQRTPAAMEDTGDGLDWLEQRIIAENERFLVVDKPAGLAVHGGTAQRLGCIEALRSLRPGLKTLELAHRLDRMTSGCLVVAKRRSALRTLHALFRDGRVEKRYLALLEGQWQLGRITVDAPLAESPARSRAKVRVDESGKQALSEFRLVEHYGRDASLVEVRIATGRTHQIRVHAAHIGHPVAGDERYGNDTFNAAVNKLGLRRMFLHAHTISFDWPGTDESFSFSAPLPVELSKLLDRLA